MAESESKSCVVYWLYDERCFCPWRHGYVGVSLRWKQRLYQHQRFWPSAFSWKILFCGTRRECLKLEWQLRPTDGIGWNENPGGGTSLSTKTLQKMSESGKQRPPISEETRNKLRVLMIGTTNKGRIGQKKSDEERAKIAIAKTGKRVSEEERLRLISIKPPTPHKGFIHTEETKQRIRLKKVGVPIHSEEHKRKLAERWQGNALTKGKPWSAARRLAWLNRR